MTSTLLQSLLQILRRPVPPQVLARASLHVTDWIACAVAGAASPAGRGFVSAAPPGPIAALGTQGTASAAESAHLMGAFGNVLEMDDIHRTSLLHPGPVIVPAALAAAQSARDPTGADLLAAIVRGYEAMIRLGRSTGSGHYSVWHKTATCGPLGAAVAAADLLKLDDRAYVWAMGNALTQAAGPWACRHEPVMTKQVHTAHAAEAGLRAALLARSGVTGPSAMVEGPQGFFAAFCPNPEPAAMIAPASDWLIQEVGFKPWPACRHCHAAIDAALILRDQVTAPAEIERVEIAVYDDAARFCDQPNPTNFAAAAFSLQHMVATVLLHGPPGFAALEGASLSDPGIVRLRARAAVTTDAGLTAAYPAHFGTALTLHVGGGRTLSAHKADPRGDPEDPMRPQDFAAKARMLWARAGRDPGLAAPVSAAVDALADAPDLNTLFTLLPKNEIEEPVS